MVSAELEDEGEARPRVKQVGLERCFARTELVRLRCSEIVTYVIKRLEMKCLKGRNIENKSRTSKKQHTIP